MVPPQSASAAPPSLVLSADTCFALPACSRSLDVDCSIIWQIDALLMCRRGPRIERDVFASSAADSFTMYYNLMPFDDLASFSSLFMHNFEVMPAVIAAAASHRAFGLFIVPVLPGAAPLIQRRAKSKAKTKAPMPWYDFLLQHSLLVFNLPRSAFHGPGARHGGCSGVVAVFAQFGVNGRIKASKGVCKERSFNVSTIRGWPPERKLQPVPQMWPRCSPLADSVAPRPSDDDAPAVPCYPPTVLDPPMALPAPTWAMEVVAKAADYPFPRVFNLAVAAMNRTLDPYMGQRLHPVPQRERPMSEDDKMVVRAKFCEMRGRGNADGPRASQPFANAHDLPFGLQLSKSYTDTPKTRLTSDAAATGKATRSLNSMTWSPHLRRVHLSAYMLGDMMVWLGPGASVTCLDIPKCFRCLKTNPKLLFLFVYRLVTKLHGVEYWTDLANTFGWIASEWGWQCCLAVIEWFFYKAGVRREFSFVDNFFCFHQALRAPAPSPFMSPPPPRRQGIDLRPIDEAYRIDRLVDMLGLGRHEQLRAVQVYHGLGWDWSWSHTGEWPIVMICQEAKFFFYLHLFRTWAAASSLTVKALEKAVGIMTWLRAGFPIGAADMAALAKLKKEGVAICKYRNLARIVHTLRVSDEVRSIFQFWTDRFSRWDRICPVVMSFGPCSLPHIRGWVDACSCDKDDLPPGQRGGCGGVFFDIASSTLVGFMHEWNADEQRLAKRVDRDSVPFYEALGVRWWTQLYAKRCRAMRLLLATDCNPVGQAISRGFSKCSSMRSVVRDIRMSFADEFVTFRLWSVVGAQFNLVADRLSHGCPEEAQAVALRLFGLQLHVSRV